MMPSATTPLSAHDPGHRAQGGFIDLDDYNLDLCKRLAQSQKTMPAIKRMARLLLEMHRQPDCHSIARRTGVSVETLGMVRFRYLRDGCQDVLELSLPEHLPSCAGRIELTQAEQIFCQSVAASQQGPRGRRRRAQGLLMLHAGKSKPQVAQMTQTCERTLQRLIQRYQAHGVEGAVNDAGRSGRPVRYSKGDFVPLIQQVVRQERPEVLRHWTMRDLRQCLARHRKEAAEMSMPTLRTLAQRAGLCFRGPVMTQASMREGE